MDVDSLRAEMQLGRDIASAFAVTDELENFEFAVAEFLDWRIGTAGPATCHGIEETRRNFFADVNLTTEDVTDGSQKLFASGFFHDVTASAGAEGAFGVKLFVVHGYDEDRKRGMKCENVSDKVEAAAAGHGDVGKHEVRTPFGELGHGLLGGASFGATGDLRLDSQQLGHAGAGHGVVVHNENGFAGG
jgi:hypothetical protein